MITSVIFILIKSNLSKVFIIILFWISNKILMGANCCAGESNSTSQPRQTTKGNSATEEKIRKAVKTVFKKYDKDNSGLLDKD